MSDRSAKPMRVHGDVYAAVSAGSRRDKRPIVDQLDLYVELGMEAAGDSDLLVAARQRVPIPGERPLPGMEGD